MVYARIKVRQGFIYAEEWRMSTREGPGISLVGVRGESAMGFVYPWRPARWQAEEAFGRRGTR